MRASCIILARGGSKGIPRKNIIDFCGMPLIAWTISQASLCPYVTDIWVSSDDEEILDVGMRYGARPVKRPADLASDNASSDSALLHSLSFIEQLGGETIDYVVAPQVTSPIREAIDFSNAFDLILRDGFDSLVTLRKIEDFFIWKNNQKRFKPINYDPKNRRRRQDIKESYVENGSFYIFKPDILKNEKCRLGGNISGYVMPDSKSFQIDSFDDLQICRAIMSQEKRKYNAYRL